MHAELTVSLRLVVAAAIGGSIGWDRQRRHKPAGLRTHAIVAMTAALVMAFADLLSRGATSPTGDAGRVTQGVLTGIGFIGAGTVIRHGSAVVGITTAATIWLVAALGLVVGAGFYLLALIATALAFVLIDALRWLERPVAVTTPATAMRPTPATPPSLSRHRRRVLTAGPRATPVRRRRHA